ncbi:PKD domain-containing protein [Pseudolysinimonas kribbensis]
MQPDGWTVAGLDTNFYAVAPSQVVGGTLLGRPAGVRFTAFAFHWTYGDGTAAARGTPGGTWQQLRLPEFDPTPTSHVYAAEGDYTIRLRVDYHAEYRFDGSAFRPIDGVITAPANDLHITVGDATTVLVSRDCASDPGGPGC